MLALCTVGEMRLDDEPQGPSLTVWVYASFVFVDSRTVEDVRVTEIKLWT